MKEFLCSFRRQITLKQLRGFSAIVRYGSVGEAARELHLTSPAVSLQLRDLEKIAGVPLFEKKNKRLVPTASGQAIVELAENMNRILIECSQTLDKIGGVDHGFVSVGVVSTARYFAPTILAAFNQKYPNVQIKLMVGNRALIMDGLETMEIDFAITGLPPNHFEVEKKFIDIHPQIIIAQPGSEFSGQSSIALSSLSEQTFLLREKGSGTQSMTEKFFKQNNFEASNTMEFGSNETIKQAVMAGMGVALISAHTVAVEIENKRLEVLRVKGLPINRKWYVVKHKNKFLLPSSLALWDFFVQSSREFLPKFDHITTD
jgi:LysR family transcriptional regulator for metE and metH